MNKLFSSGINGVGSCLPEKVLTNFDLEKIVDTSDEWIKARTGIGSRRICDDKTNASDLAARAAELALQDAGLQPEEVDLIIVATVTGDMVFPSTACIVQKKIVALNAAAFDVEAACSGFLYGLTIGDQFIKTGMYKNVLVIGVDVFSRILDWEDRKTCVLFGDGAGAVVLQRIEEGSGILSSYIGADGTGSNVLTAGGDRILTTPESIENKLKYVKMDGSEVFKFAVRTMEKATLEALKRCNMSLKDIDFLIPHQANMRIIDAGAKRLKLTPEQVYVNIDKYANMSAASIPVALDEAVKIGLMKKGDVLVLVAFGAGLTWSCNVVKWCK